MADDQRPYRSNDAIARGGQAKPSASDPLAELARLIGQSDPFGEYARDNARRPAAQPGAPAADWSQQQQTASYAPQTIAPETQSYGYPAAGADSYTTEGQIPAYLMQRGEAAGQGDHAAYDHAAYDPNNAPYNAEHEDYYDDAPPSRRRMGIMVIAGVFALAVLGTAGAFGYRALFGSSSGGGQPPVIKADTAPSKVVPASTAKDAGSNKLITDRVGGASGEKLVSREEQPIEVRDKPAGVIFPAQRETPTPSGNVAAMGSGVVGSEPKKIRTIAIHPDGSAAVADATSSSVPTPEPPRQAPPPQQQRTVSAPPPAAPAPARVAAPAPAPSNAPLSLSPNAPSAQPRAAAPTRTASAPAAPTASGGGSGTFVQVSSQRSEGDAQAAFRALQGKFPGQLGNRQPVIHRADLGAKGIYFRAMVGPLAGSEASELCSSLKAAGGQCIIQRN